MGWAYGLFVPLLASQGFESSEWHKGFKKTGNTARFALGKRSLLPLPDAKSRPKVWEYPRLSTSERVIGIEGLGDLNRDGADDILISHAPGDGTTIYRYSLFFGSRFGFGEKPDQVINLPVPQTSDHLISTLVGYFYGDEELDVLSIIFCNRQSKIEQRECIITTFKTNGKKLETTKTWTTRVIPDFEVARMVSDMNGDGKDDILLVTGERADRAQQIRIVAGAEEPDFSKPIWSHVQPIGCPASSYYSSGDPNGDGKTDLLVSWHAEHGIYRDSGVARLFLGQESGLSKDPAWIGMFDLVSRPHIEQVGGHMYGWRVDIAPDLNGDGLDDIVVGAPAAEKGDDFDEGVVFVYYGRRDAKWKSADWVKDSDRSNQSLGEMVLGGGGHQW